MENDTATNPAPEAPEVATEEAPETEANQPATEPEVDDEGNPVASQEDAEEYEEVDREGKKYRVPKALASELMMQADYTRKTQEVAEARRAFEAEIQQREQEYQVKQELFQDSSQLSMVEQRLNAFRNTNWQAWSQQDPNGTQAALAEYTQLRDHHANLSQTIQAKSAHLAAQREQETANSLNKAREQLAKPNPDIGWDGRFDEAKRNKLREVGRQLGWSEERLNNVYDPADIYALHIASIGMEAVKKSKSVAKTPASIAKPVPQVGAGKTNTAIVNPDKLSPEEWVKWREKQIAKRQATR
jgi:hypothetical protein